MARINEWSDKKVEKLYKLFSDGVGLSKIAENLGVSKNAVVGKISRMGWPRRPNPVKREPSDAPKSPAATQKPTRAASEQAARLPIPTQPLAPAVLRPNPHRQAPCSWPTSDGRPWTFCGAPSAAGKPYCEAHVKLAYERTPRYPLRGFS